MSPLASIIRFSHPCGRIEHELRQAMGERPVFEGVLGEDGHDVVRRYASGLANALGNAGIEGLLLLDGATVAQCDVHEDKALVPIAALKARIDEEIGRASCRERV